MDLSRQFHHLLVAIWADADKCYNRINHITMSFLLCAIVGNTGAVVALLTPIQTMKFYQCTGRGNLNTYMGGRPTSGQLQGLCQGNRAAPVCWLMKISTIMACYKKAGYGSLVVAPISNEVIELMGEIYVDDFNILVFLAGILDCKQLMNITQASLEAWAELLNATGGTLNPAKCYWYLVAYICINGKWEYNHVTTFNLFIPLPDGLRAAINQTHINEAKKMLSVWSTPSGNDTQHLEECIVAQTKHGWDGSKMAHFRHI